MAPQKKGGTKTLAKPVEGGTKLTSRLELEPDVVIYGTPAPLSDAAVVKVGLLPIRAALGRLALLHQNGAVVPVTTTPGG